jgi:propanediol dehydratase large subunit
MKNDNRKMLEQIKRAADVIKKDCENYDATRGLSRYSIRERADTIVHICKTILEKGPQ